MAKEKLKIAFYWAASCGGCEIAVLDINEKILDVLQIADIVLWPVAMDVKYKDVEAMDDSSIDVCFFIPHRLMFQVKFNQSSLL